MTLFDFKLFQLKTNFDESATSQDTTK